jgi:hypothetical protein
LTSNLNRNPWDHGIRKHIPVKIKLRFLQFLVRRFASLQAAFIRAGQQIICLSDHLERINPQYRGLIVDALIENDDDDDDDFNPDSSAWAQLLNDHDNNRICRGHLERCYGESET